ncbi:hypothetical protein L596_026328 [Steinernema carpocapsae]|uniref:Uncharacterized protein n=1 Tax=Steinernema carpocapsae TaxID=34508 RepID=A0A4U5M110_STECR|nr:hypothetical protein L596_026328 [Steinernema carpocapsae]
MLCKSVQNYLQNSPKTRQSRLRNPQTARKSSYPARVIEVVAELFKVALKCSASTLSISMVLPGDSRRRVFKLVAVAVRSGDNLGDVAVTLKTLSLSPSLPRMSLKAVYISVSF